LVLLVVYFVGGILLLRYWRGARGVEQIPNLEFWKSLPLLIKVMSEFGDFLLLADMPFIQTV